MSFPRFFIICCCYLLLGASLSCAEQRPDTGPNLSNFVEVEATVNADASDASPIQRTSAKIRDTVDWPQWRGVAREGKSLERGLLQKWPEGGPRLVWTHRSAGKGFSGPAGVGKRVFLLGTDRAGSTTIAFALNAETGERVWATPVGDVYGNGWGDGPRSTPTVDSDRVFVLAGQGDLACLDAETGDILWSKNLVRDFGGRVPGWGYCESPLVDGERLVVVPGGQRFLVMLDKRTGRITKTSTGLSDGAQYASVVTTNAGRESLYLTMTNRGLVGISAKTGALQFRYEKSGNGTAVVPTPIVQDEFVYSTSGYSGNCGLVRLRARRGSVMSTEIYSNRNMVNHHGGVVFHKGHLYGFSEGKGWVCQNFKTGELAWNQKSGLAKGSIAYADNRLYCYGQSQGTMVLAEASPNGWKEHGRFRIPERTQLDRRSGQIWTHPVIAGGKLYLRDQDLLFCFDVKQ